MSIYMHTLYTNTLNENIHIGTLHKHPMSLYREILQRSRSPPVATGPPPHPRVCVHIYIYLYVYICLYISWAQGLWTTKRVITPHQHYAFKDQSQFCTPKRLTQGQWQKEVRISIWQVVVCKNLGTSCGRIGASWLLATIISIFALSVARAGSSCIWLANATGHRRIGKFPTTFELNTSSNFGGAVSKNM